MGFASGLMYSVANVSGPDEFGRLPKKDQLFWNAWLEGAAERAEQQEQSLQETLGNTGVM